MKHTPSHQIMVAAAPKIQIGHSLAEFGDWPRCGVSKRARCFAHQSAEVLEVWCDTIGKARNIEPVFVGMRTPSGQPALLIPLGLQRHRGNRVLRFLDGGASDYNAPVVFSEASELGNAERIWTDIKPHLPPFDVAILEKMPEKVEDLPNPLFAVASHSRHESCHVVQLYGPSEQFSSERFPNAADSRRRRRKLEALGKVRIQIAQDDRQRTLFLDAMMRMKRKKFFETKGYDAFAIPGAGEFYRQTTERLGKTGPVQLSALTLDDRILAAHWGYVDGNRFYQLMPSHEAGEWRNFSPGRLLNEWLMQWSIEQGLKFFDFGIGDEPYKFDYCDLHVPLGNAYLPATQKGRLYSTALRLEQAARDAARDNKLGAALIAVRKWWLSRKPPSAELSSAA